jgi:parallel beta-helix repeat protein
MKGLEKGTRRGIDRNVLGLLHILLFVLVWLPRIPSAAAQQQGFVLYVNNTDTTCGGHAPCFSTVQAAVTATVAGDTVTIQAGTYAEQVDIRNKNTHAEANENDRIVIEADPHAPPGSVVIAPPTSSCSGGEALRVQNTKFVTLRGLTITGAGGQGIRVVGEEQGNQAIHLERNRIFGNGVGSCNGGITVGEGNPQTVIVNNLIYGNTRNGIAFLKGSGGPHIVLNNTIHGNGWNGIDITRAQQVLLINNVITQNGWASDAVNDGFGVRRETGTSLSPTDLSLFHNLVCGNYAGEVHGPLLDSTDAGNLMPTAREDKGVAASPGCEVPTNVYAQVLGPDGLMHTADDDFTLLPTSPALDKGIDSRTLGLLIAPASLLADFANDARRPADGDNSGVAQFDMGALERVAPPTAPQQVGVPAVVGLTEAAAVVTLEGAGLMLGAVSQTYSTTVPAGQIMSQTPAAGTAVAVGAMVHVVVSSGTTDSEPPSVTITAPSALVTNTQPGIAVTYADAGTGLDLTTLRILLDTSDVTASCFVAATAASCGEVFFTEGYHTVEVHLSDMAGNLATASRQVFLDTTPPRLTIDASVVDAVSTTGSITITGTIDASAFVQVTVNGLVAQVTAGHFVVEAVPLQVGRNIITVVATDGVGNTTTTEFAVVFRDPQAFISLEILSPSAGALLSSAEVMVHGTLTNATGQETGVTVNGIVALVYDGHFVANQVPLQEGENILTVLAVDSAGNTASAFMTLYREATGGYIRLTAETYAGFAPLETTVHIESPVPLIASTVSVTGPGTAEVVLGAWITEYVVRLSATGLYTVTAEVSDEDGNQYTHTLALQVLALPTLDTALRARWNGMKQALANQDTHTAANFFTDETKELYREIFALLLPQLPQLVQEMQDIEMVWAADQTAQYRIRRQELYDGQPLTITHYIYFRVDSDGLWKILRY